MKTSIWDHVQGGGYITDAMLETGSNNPVVSPCSASSDGTPSATCRQKAIAWAYDPARWGIR